MPRPMQPPRRKLADWADHLLAALLRAAVLAAVIAVGVAVLRHTTQTLTEFAYGDPAAVLTAAPVK